MPCVHLRELFSLCQEHDLKIASSDLVRVVCRQCGVVETCPSTFAQEYDATHHEGASLDDPVPGENLSQMRQQGDGAASGADVSQTRIPS